MNIPYGPRTFESLVQEGLAEDRRRFPRGPRPTPRPVTATKAARRRRAHGRRQARGV